MKGKLMHKFNKSQIALLEKTRDAVLAHPETVNMDNWIQHDEEVEPEGGAEDGYCGTVACLAGHVGLVAGLPPKPWLDEEEILEVAPKFSNWESRHVSDVAAHLLGLEFEYAQQTIFDVDGWPVDYRLAYRTATDAEQRAKALAALIDHMIEVGGIDWQGEDA